MSYRHPAQGVHPYQTLRHLEQLLQANYYPRITRRTRQTKTSRDNPFIAPQVSGMQKRKPNYHCDLYCPWATAILARTNYKTVEQTYIKNVNPDVTGPLWPKLKKTA